MADDLDTDVSALRVELGLPPEKESRRKPWIEQKISRATWYRRRKGLSKSIH